MHRIIAIARSKRLNKKKYSKEYDSDECVSSDNEQDISADIVGSIINKYLVIKYIGKGTFSRVWLVYNLIEGKYYALKKQFAEYYKDGLHELKMFNIIGNECDHLVKLKEYFIITKNEDSSICFVCELLGSEVFEFIDKYDRKVPISIVKSWMRDILTAIDYIHTKNVIHTDLKLENILLENIDEKVKNTIDWFNSLNPMDFIKENSELTEDIDNAHRRRRLRKRLRVKAYKKLALMVKEHSIQQLDTISDNTSDTTSDNTSDNMSDSMSDNTDKDIIEVNEDSEISTYNLKDDIKEIDFEEDIDIRVKICDFGNCCKRDDHIMEEIQTRQYRSPEVIINNNYDTSSDIWSLGCILFELITGEYLFDVAAGKNELDRNRKHLALMYEVLGKMPKKLSMDCEFSEDYFDAKGRVLKYKKDINYTNIEELILEERDDIDKIELITICDLLKKMLGYNPKTRITAKDCLQEE